MSLRRFAVQNYRCFRDRQELEVLPVTLVLGKNNSGKSALVRAPLIFATGFNAKTSAPVDFDHLGPDAVDAFTDLIFEQSPHGAIKVEFEVEGRVPFCLHATLQHVAESRDAFVSELDLRVGEGSVGMSWVPGVDSNRPHRYEIRSATGEPRYSDVHFRGLLPVDPPISELCGWRGDPLSLGPIRYLSPYRKRLARHHRLPLGVPQELGAQGEGMSAVLANDKARGRGELISVVNQYLRDIVPEWQLDEVSVGPLWATVLTRSTSKHLQVNLADAGAGLAQVLPILVQCALDEQIGKRAQAPLQVIEEPEMHLHPAAHAELADLYLRTARATGTRFLIETHSETLLLRLRRRIAEGECNPGDVGIYVVEQRNGVSEVHRVDVDELGSLDDEWPEGYFSQDYHEVRALASAQLQRSRDASSD